MKRIITLLLLITITIFAYHYFSPNITEPETVDISDTQKEQEIILGCYKAGNNQDVYILSIENQEQNNVSGTLTFDNFEKDSSSGTFVGFYENNKLLADYTFKSEGIISTMEIGFIHDGNTFIRGYGDVMNEGTEFVDPGNLNYEKNELSVFEKINCNSQKNVESFVWEYEESTENNLDGFPKTNIFLVVQYEGDTSEKLLVDTVDGSCNDLPEFDQDVVLNSTQIQCYYAGLGYRFKVVKESNNYLVKRQKFEETLPDYDMPDYEYEVVITI